MYSFQTEEELKRYIAENVISTSEAMEELGCSRQNLDDLVRRGRLAPIKQRERVRLFWRPDILEWKQNKAIRDVAEVGAREMDVPEEYFAQAVDSCLGK